MGETPTKMRLDKWLWAARFFKTRTLAAAAINGGKVHVHGQRVKPSKEIQVGSQVEITKEPYTFEVVVTALSSQRRPAKEASLLYQELPQSLARRQEEATHRRLQQAIMAPAKRPDKKQRRQIHRFKRAENEWQPS
ncbi:MAG: S4 domain-containing protein [Methylohalobius sp.]|nr:S4 domain-containing protein [Methylohalobius sp.]